MKLSKFIFKMIDKIKTIDRKIYQPDAGVWHTPTSVVDEDPKCWACLGGMYAAAMQWAKPTEALMVNSHRRNFRRLSEKQKNTMHLLNYIRVGNWADAIDKLNDIYETNVLPPLSWDFDPGQPEQAGFYNWDQFDKHIESLSARAKELQKAGY